MVWLPRHETEALHAGRGPLYPPMSAPDWRYQFYGGPDLRGDMVIVVGCDRRYFQYFPNFLLSAIKAQGKSDAGPRIAVHCHVADPQQDQTDFLEQCMGDLNHPPCMLQLSCSVPGPAQFNDPSYYTCLRFLALPDIMAFYRCGWSWSWILTRRVERWVRQFLPTHWDIRLRATNVLVRPRQQSAGRRATVVDRCTPDVCFRYADRRAIRRAFSAITSLPLTIRSCRPPGPLISARLRRATTLCCAIARNTRC